MAELFGFGLAFAIYGALIWRYRAPYVRDEKWWRHRSGVDVAVEHRWAIAGAVVAGTCIASFAWSFGTVCGAATTALFTAKTRSSYREHGLGKQFLADTAWNAVTSYILFIPGAAAARGAAGFSAGQRAGFASVWEGAGSPCTLHPRCSSPGIPS